MTGDERSSAFAGLGQRGLVSRMHEQLDEMLAARDQMEQLLRVIVEIGAGLDLDATLHRIIVAARELTSAPYGALAVRDPEGNLLSFVHEGIDADDGPAHRTSAGRQGPFELVAPRYADSADG